MIIMVSVIPLCWGDIGLGHFRQVLGIAQEKTAQQVDQGTTRTKERKRLITFAGVDMCGRHKLVRNS
jgi:hypothetical protein